MKLSVIVPFLNESRWLPLTLKALSRQILCSDEYELIFVDNGSTDGSAAIVAGHPKVQLLYESRQDPYLARNRGIASAMGEYIVFLDADCLADPHWLLELHNAAKLSTAAILIGAIDVPSSASLPLQTFQSYYNQKLSWLIANKRTRNYFGHAGNMAVRREVFENYGLFKPMPIVGDTEIIHRLLAHCPDVEILFVSEARVIHAEVNSVWTILVKIAESGGHTESLIPDSDFRPIELIDKLRIASATLKEMHWDVTSFAAFIFILGFGWPTFVLGRVARRLRRGNTVKECQPFQTIDRVPDARH